MANINKVLKGITDKQELSNRVARFDDQTVYHCNDFGFYLVDEDTNTLYTLTNAQALELNSWDILSGNINI